MTLVLDVAACDAGGMQMQQSAVALGAWNGPIWLSAPVLGVPRRYCVTLGYARGLRSYTVQVWDDDADAEVYAVGGENVGELDSFAALETACLGYELVAGWGVVPWSENPGLADALREAAGEAPAAPAPSRWFRRA